MTRAASMTLIATALLAAGAARAGEPLYAVAWWDGAADRPGFWFLAEGPTVADGVALARVDHLDPGLVIRPAPGRLVLSAELAVLLGVPARTPTLVRVGADSPEPLAPTLAWAASPGSVGASENPAQTDAAAHVADHQSRITALLLELQQVAAEATRADAAQLAAATSQITTGQLASGPGPVAEPAAGPARAPRRGGLVPFMPEDRP